MSTTPTARRGRTRARLVEAAAGVFAERGVDGASVELICERAGFTRGAFYSNFATKEQLLFAVTEDALQESLTRIEDAAARWVPPVDAPHADHVTELVRHFLGTEDPRGVRIEMELHRLAQTDPEAKALVLRIHEQVESRILGVVDSVTSTPQLRLRAEPLVVIRTLVALYRQAAEMASLTGSPELDLALLTAYVHVVTEPVSPRTSG